MSVARIGLTGGIGSGKSSAAEMFAGLGVPVLDLDAVGRQLVAPGSEAARALIEAFGESIAHADGSIDRKTLAACCFADAERTARLNAIMHPRIRDYEAGWLAAQQAPYAVIEASVLIESGGAGRMDAVIVVLADEGLRERRVVARGDRDAAAFRDIVARQCGDELRRRVADYLIVNEGTLTALCERVAEVKRELDRAYP